MATSDLSLEPLAWWGGGGGVEVGVRGLEPIFRPEGAVAGPDAEKRVCGRREGAAVGQSGRATLRYIDRPDYRRNTRGSVANRLPGAMCDVAHPTFRSCWLFGYVR